MEQAKVTDYFRCKRRKVHDNKLHSKALELTESNDGKKHNLESHVSPVLTFTKRKREELESYNDIVSTPCKKLKFEALKLTGKEDGKPQVLSELTDKHPAGRIVENSISKLQTTPRGRDVNSLERVTPRLTTSCRPRKQKTKDKILYKTPSTPASDGTCTKPTSHSARKRLLGLLVQGDCPQSIHAYEGPEEKEALLEAKDQLANDRKYLKSIDHLQTSHTSSETSVEHTKNETIDLTREERVKAIQEKFSKRDSVKAKIEEIEFTKSLDQAKISKVLGQSFKGSNTSSSKEETAKKIQESISKILGLKDKLKESQNTHAGLKEKFSQVPAYQRYHGLACSPSKALPLPYKYKSLEESFQNSDRILSILHNRHEISTFSKLKQSVERVTKRTFNKTHLGQIKTVFPQAYHFSVEKKLNALSSDSSTGDQLIILPNLDYEDTKPVTGDVKPLHDQYKTDFHKATGSVKKKSYVAMDSACLTKRRSVFHHSILEITRKHHEKFLESLNPPVHISSEKVLRWHYQFPLDSVPDIPVSLLPGSVDNKYLKAKDVLCLIKNRTDKKVVKAVQSVAEKHAENEENETLQTKSSLAKLVEKGALKGIPLSLLEKVSRREGLHMQRVMTRQPEVEKRLEMISRFPEFVNILRNYFITSQKAAIGIDDVSKKLADSYRSHITTETAEQHLYLMADLLPEWISVITISKGPFVKIDKKKDVKIVIEKINCLMKQDC